MDSQFEKKLRSERLAATLDDPLDSIFAYSAWPLNEAVKIALKRLDTMLVMKSVLKRKGLYEEKIVSGEEELELVEKWMNRFKDRALAAIASGQLPTIMDEFQGGKRKVALEPRTFLLWAKDQDCNVDWAIQKLDSLQPVKDSTEPSQEKVARKFNTPEGATWKDVTLRLTKDGKVKVTVGKVSEKVTFMDMGLEIERTSNPRSACTVLKQFANEDNNIIVPRQVPKARDLLGVHIRELRKILCSYFGIEADPIFRAKGKAGRIESYKTVFLIEPETRLRNNAPDLSNVYDEETSSFKITQDGYINGYAS